jgi:hypothetical protein
LAIEKERRQLPRVEVNWPITIYTDINKMEGETQNISSEGLYICCDNPLPLNKIFRMSISPPEHQSIGVTGKVVWSDMYGIEGKEDFYGIGICLVKISSAEQKQLHNIISNYV